MKMPSVVWNIFRRDKKWRCTCTVCGFVTRLRIDGSTTVMLKHHKARCGRVDGGQKENTATTALSPRLTSNNLSSIVEEIEVHQDHKENTPLSPRLTLTPIMEETAGQQNILVTLLTDMLKEEPI